MDLVKLSTDIIDKVKTEVGNRAKEALGSDLQKCVLYGSCARGDFNENSDIDIALLTNCNRMEAKNHGTYISKI